MMNTWRNIKVIQSPKRILLCSIFLISIVIGLVGQETPFHWYGPPAYMGDFSGHNTNIENVKINSQNRCYYLTRYNQWNTVEDTNTYALGYLDTDNIPHTVSLDDTSMLYPDGNYEMALFGTGVAVPCLEGNNFFWRYYDTVNSSVVSDTLTLPFANVTWMALSQADEAHALLMFRDDTGECFVAYVDAQAHAVWSFTMPSSIAAADDMICPEAALIDYDHFIIGVVKSNPHTLNIIRCNSSGEMENTASIEIDGYAYLFPTRIPGTVVFSYLYEGAVHFSRYADGVVTDLMTSYPQLHYMMAAGDETGFLFLGRSAINGLRMEKHNWDGDLLWQKTWDASTYGRQDNLAISASGNYCLGLEEQGRYLLARVMGNGETTGTVDDSAVDVPVRGFRTYPNPFGDDLKVSITTQTPQNVAVSVYNIKGQLVRNWEGFSAKAGLNELVWDGRDAQGRAVSAGLYFIRVQTQDWTQVQKALCWYK